MQFVYALPGWEGSAGDSRVLRDAVSRVNGLKVPKGYYYLCDNGYANSDGFLTPFRGVRYHLKEWGPGAESPQNAIELFNMRHTKARNVIERAFAVLKMRWGILRISNIRELRRWMGSLTAPVAMGRWTFAAPGYRRLCRRSGEQRLDGVHLALVTALRSHFTSLADAECASASVCRAVSCEDDYWFSLHNKDDMLAIVAALEASSTVYDIIASSMRRN
ncbi:uncharacterized protein LOC125209123 [Salvia hispanica]|uniref:uncharacterized protein LOC125209123 n=1 Tax=Salvia hispanica TaxID=49212 RepID=UPI002009CEE4|nr:uncharacterized protein LOC125209123 [Salvia hispanica]